MPPLSGNSTEPDMASEVFVLDGSAPLPKELSLLYSDLS